MAAVNQRCNNAGNRIPRVVLITNECAPVVQTMKKVSLALRALRKVLGLKHFTVGVLGESLLPLSFLQSLHNAGTIRLILHMLPSEEGCAYTRELADAIEKRADIWMFALNSFFVDVTDFLTYARKIGEAQGIVIMNCFSDSKLDESTSRLSSMVDLPTFPVFIKPRQNGMAGNYNSEINDACKYSLVTNEHEYKSFQDELTPIQRDSYILQKYHMHAMASHFPPKFIVIERWLYVAGELIVGTRIGDDIAVKQNNSVTWYKRDARHFASDYKQNREYVQGWLRKKAKSMPLTFGYEHDSDFWDIRVQALDRYIAGRDVVCAVLDAIHDPVDGICIIDLNAQAFEGVGDDLFMLLRNTLLQCMCSKVAAGGNTGTA
eukprot:gene1358-1959_t